MDRAQYTQLNYLLTRLRTHEVRTKRKNVLAKVGLLVFELRAMIRREEINSDILERVYAHLDEWEGK